MCHIDTMPNIFDRLRKRQSTGPDSPEGEPAGVSSATAPTEDKGVDPRRRAEEKADAAGEKWRAEAEARGEIAKEVGGPKGLEPTRYGDWEKAGRCFDF